ALGSCACITPPSASYPVTAFLDLIANSTINKKKAIVPPVRVTAVGPAFFDAQHRGAKALLGAPARYFVAGACTGLRSNFPLPSTKNTHSAAGSQLVVCR